MSDSPQLVFVKGPQTGQRVSLQGERITAGRSSDCQLPLKEHYVSRRQMQLTRTPEGWILENMSSNGTMVNGRRYKADQQILLATGDLLGVGMETEILFVAEGDDPKEALAKYIQSQPSPEPKPSEPAAPPPDQPAEGELPPPPEDEMAPATESIASLSEVEVQAQQRKAKMKKYLVMLAVSVAITIGVIALSSFVGTPSGPVVLSGTPVRLTADQIRAAITAIPTDITPGATQAASELQLANQFFQNHLLPGQLYACIRHYKFYLAYRGSAGFEHGEDEQRYRTALDGDRQGDPGLVGAVRILYDRACEDELAQRWADALPLFVKLERIVPAEPDDPTYEKLLKNIIEHRKFVQLKMAK
jgi:hypothetical protein